MIDKRIIGIVVLIMIALPIIAIAQPGPGNQLPYDIKIISTQAVGEDLWTCYEVYDEDELLFYDCVITDKKATSGQIKSVLEYSTKIIYDSQNKPLIGNKKVDKNMDCWEYSKKLGDWIWVC